MPPETTLTPAIAGVPVIVALGECPVILNETGRFGNMKSFEIFKSGKFTAKGGQQVDFSDADLSAIAAAYDPAVHEAPLVVGHPATDAPAYGWVRDLAFADGALVATPSDVDAAFSEMVLKGLFKKRSAAFYPPAHPSNPKPGNWSLKHVGFLGAEAPAVKGLKPVAFSGGDEGTVILEFSDRDELWSLASAFRSMAAMARGFREFLIAEKGQEEADRLASNWQIDELVGQSERISEKARDASPSFSEPTPEASVKTQQEIDTAAAALATRETALATREAELAARDAQFSEAARVTRHTENERVIDTLIAEGRFAPGMKPATLDFMDSLEAVTTIEFSEGAAKVKKTPAAFFAELLQTSGKVINFAEVSAAETTQAGALEFAAPDGAVVDEAQLQLHRKAEAYQASHPNTDYMAAVRAVSR